MNLSHKIYGLIATVLLMMLAVAGLAAKSMNDIGTLLVEIAEEDIPLSNIVAEITVNQLGQALWLERAIGAVEQNRMRRMMESEHQFREINALVVKEFAKAEAISDRGIEMATTEIGREKFEQVSAALREIETVHSTYAMHAEAMFEAFNAGRVAGDQEAIENIEQEQEALEQRLEAFLLDLERFTANAALDAEHAEQSSLRLLIILTVLGLAIGSALGFFLIRSIVGPIKSAVDFMARMSEGDLTSSIEANSSDEIGQLLAQMADMQHKLTEIVSNIQQASSAVKSGSSEISQGNANLSQRSEEHASSLEETASSMEQMTSTVKQNADNASEANQLAMAAREEAEKGGAVVSQAVQAMNEINASSKKISDIIGVIDEIAFQTNLLALNASVEAARAGDQGRGFAVVASEVRNLAGRSATAAKEIKDLIVDSASKVDEGSRLVNESGATLEEIVNGVKKVTDIVGEIAAASKEQAAGIDEVNRAIVQMDDMTQQNAALVEQAAAAAESLGEQADDLNELTTFFTLESGTAATKATATSPATRAERRTADRPWTAPETAETREAIAVPASPIKKAAAGDGDQEWEEF